MTDLLKKEAFKWGEEAQVSFDMLKGKMTNPPVLALLDFSKPFCIETDASGMSMGAVLMQNLHPIAYISKAFSNRNAMMSAYERELLAIVFAIKKWQHYLSIQPFVIRTDQR